MYFTEYFQIGSVIPSDGVHRICLKVDLVKLNPKGNKLPQTVHCEKPMEIESLATQSLLDKACLMFHFFREDST
jgi:hypothetical protein